MNSTLGAQSAPVPDGGNPFSRANVIGTFLVLQLCQLTQPYGSLLFRSAGGFFWRCNPLSSFAEACIIFWHLVATILQCWQEGRAGILKRLQETSAGLLLLRGAGGRSDAEGLMQKLMTGSFLDKDDESAMQHSPRESPERRNSASTMDAQGNTLMQTTKDRLRTLPRQSTLEANQPPSRANTLSAFDPKSEKARILREAFGSNALAHKELRVDFATAFTEFCILVKLLAVKPYGWFTTAAAFLVLGWSAVQMLLIFFHGKEMDETEMATAVRLTRTLNAELKEQQRWWTTFFIILHLPFFAYPAYLAGFHPWFSADARGLIGLLRFLGWYIRLMGAWFITLFSISGVLGIKIFASIAPASRVRKITLGMFLLVLSAWLAVASSRSFFVNIINYEEDKYTPGSLFYIQPQTPMYYLVDQSYAFMYKVFCFLLILFLIAWVYAKTLFHGRDALQRKKNETNTWDSFTEEGSTLLDRKRTSLGNAIFVLVVFILYVISYDAEATQKPWWTDYLG